MGRFSTPPARFSEAHQIFPPSPPYLQYVDYNGLKLLIKFVNKPVPDWGTICHI